MANTDLEGAFTALATPFDNDLDIDVTGFRQNIDFQIEQGINGLVPMGTTGESPTMSREEHEVVVELVVDQANGRVPVIAGAGSNNTEEALHYTKHAEDVGADAALVICPYYNKPTQEGLYEHFKTVAENVNIPIVLYNVPGRTGRNIDADTIIRLSEIDNIVAVKEASGNLDQMMDIIKGTEDDFLVLSGDDGLTFPLLALGGKGVISVASNIVPDILSEMVAAYFKGKINVSKALHYKYLDLFRIIFVETNPAPIKEAMDLMGMPAGSLRLPLVPVSPESSDKIEVVLKELELL